MNLLLFGAPGAGKGTQSALLVERRGYRHISTGDLFRAAIKNETALGLEAKKYMDKGELVPDSIVIGMVDEELQTLQGQSFILDGFPRTVPQADALDNLLKESAMKIDKAIFLEVPREQIVKRLSGRRMTPDGKHVYHVEYAPPKVAGICDVTGEKLIQRNDDKEEVIERRLEAYDSSTKPLKDYYRKKGNLVELNGVGSAEEVYSRISQALDT